MAPSEHLDWFDDNISWFEQIDVTLFDTPVPACPGWHVEYVLNHLSFGLGLAYAAAIDQPPTADPETVFADVDFPTTYPSGNEARTAFTMNLRSCASAFRRTASDTPCWTYGGGGTAASSH